MLIEESGRIVISDADLWRPVEARSSALRQEDRRGLDSRRVIAFLIDRLVLAIPTAVCVTVLGEGGWLVATALMLAYFFLCEALTGQTVGKALLGLRVVRLDGGPLNVAAVAARNVLLLVDQALIGALFMIVTRHRQRIGDLIAGTVVTTAADHRHIPASDRARTAVLVGYPAAWIGAAAIAAVLAAGDADRREYLAQANLTCVNARQALSAIPGAGVEQARATIATVEDTLRALQPPAEARAGHARLVAAIHRQRALLWRATVAHRSELPQIQARYRATVARDGRELRRLGYAGCA
jgi:uncharacterized RDD family membrane protein YckC